MSTRAGPSDAGAGRKGKPSSSSRPTASESPQIGDKRRHPSTSGESDNSSPDDSWHPPQGEVMFPPATDDETFVEITGKSNERAKEIDHLLHRAFGPTAEFTEMMKLKPLPKDGPTDAEPYWQEVFVWRAWKQWSKTSESNTLLRRCYGDSATTDDPVLVQKFEDPTAYNPILNYITWQREKGDTRPALEAFLRFLENPGKGFLRRDAVVLSTCAPGRSTEIMAHTIFTAIYQALNSSVVNRTDYLSRSMSFLFEDVYLGKYLDRDRGDPRVRLEYVPVLLKCMAFWNLPSLRETFKGHMFQGQHKEPSFTLKLRYEYVTGLRRILQEWRPEGATEEVLSVVQKALLPNSAQIAYEAMKDFRSVLSDAIEGSHYLSRKYIGKSKCTHYDQYGFLYRCYGDAMFFCKHRFDVGDERPEQDRATRLWKFMCADDSNAPKFFMGSEGRFVGSLYHSALAILDLTLKQMEADRDEGGWEADANT